MHLFLVIWNDIVVSHLILSSIATRTFDGKVYLSPFDLIWLYTWWFFKNIWCIVTCMNGIFPFPWTCYWKEVCIDCLVMHAYNCFAGHLSTRLCNDFLMLYNRLELKISRKTIFTTQINWNWSCSNMNIIDGVNLWSQSSIQTINF